MVLARVRDVVLILALVVAWPAVVVAQGEDGAVGVADAGREPTHVAPVTVDGVLLFKLRGVSSFPAEERAQRTADAIRKVARDPAVDAATVAVVDEGSVSWIVAGDVHIVGLVDADARLEGVNRSELALVAARRIAYTITRYRAEREPNAVVAAGVRTLAATGALAGILALVLWAARRLDRRIAARLEQHLRSLGVESVREGSAARAGTALRGGIRAVRTALVLVAVSAYLHVVLGLFPWTRPIHARLADWLVGPLRTMGAALVEQIPNVIFLVILFLVMRWSIALVRLFFDAVARGAVTLGGFDPEWALPTFKIVRLVMIAFGVVVAYPYIPGSSTGAFKGVSLFVGVVFSLGSSSVIANVIAGYMMTYRRAFRIGDRIRVGATTGTVTDVRLQVTHLRTPKNEEVVLPNSVILANEVTNYSTLAKVHGLILHTTVGIGYETPWRQVEAMLVLAAERTPGLLREPPPFVLQTALGDFAVTYELNVHTDRPEAVPQLYAELHRQILDAFNEYGVAIMTPAYEGDPEQPKVVPREQWYAAPAEPPPGTAGGGATSARGSGEPGEGI